MISICLLTANLLSAYASENVTIEVKPGQTIRDIAAVHLEDPNLWKTILSFNNIEDAATVKPGKKLRIPVALVRRITRRLDAALAEIQRATEAGAKVFARQLIGEAVARYDAALSSRKADQWKESIREASEAEEKARAAYDEAMLKREAKVKAILDYRKNIVCAREEDKASWGQVPESICTRRQLEAGWRESQQYDLIVEQEKIRTGSVSEAGIVFFNVSDVRLEEYSQLTVGPMRIDRLKRRTKATCRVEDGTVTFRRPRASARSKTEVRVKNDPQVRIERTSRNYDVTHNASETKVTNRDSQSMWVASNGNSVMLEQNQRTTIRNQQRPGPATPLRAGPDLVSPGDEEVLFQHNARLTWTPIKGATRYWLEVATNRLFRPLIINNWRIKKPQFFVGNLPTGDYDWRVAAFDSTGDDSAKSEVRRFSLQSDENAPYLTIESPREGTILRQTPAPLIGRTDRDSMLTLNGQAMTLEPDGRFELEYRFLRGLNTLILEARDRAGHVTTLQRFISYLPDDKPVIRYDPSLPRLGAHHFLTRFDTLALTGMTEVGWLLQVWSESGGLSASSFADNNGRFQLNIPVNGERERLTLQAVSPSGFETQVQLTATKDQTPPTIAVDEDAPPPSATRELTFRLRGQAQGAVAAMLNGRALQLDDEHFDVVITLTPGQANRIILTTRDLAGNEAVASWVIRHDSTPPKLIRPKISYRSRSGKRIANIKVTARDPSGLKQAAPYQLRIGDAVQSGFLKLGRKGRTYQDNVPVPRKAKVELLSVELSDYAGNRRAYAFK